VVDSLENMASEGLSEGDSGDLGTNFCFLATGPLGVEGLPLRSNLEGGVCGTLKPSSFFTLTLLIAPRCLGVAVFDLASGDGGSVESKSEPSLKDTTFFLFRGVGIEVVWETVENLEVTEESRSRRSLILARASRLLVNWLADLGEISKEKAAPVSLEVFASVIELSRRERRCVAC
jgi:hypothetical protein